MGVKRIGPEQVLFMRRRIHPRIPCAFRLVIPGGNRFDIVAVGRGVVPWGQFVACVLDPPVRAVPARIGVIVISTLSHIRRPGSGHLTENWVEVQKRTLLTRAAEVIENHNLLRVEIGPTGQSHVRNGKPRQQNEVGKWETAEQRHRADNKFEPPYKRPTCQQVVERLRIRER